ncbi:hypothetical protein F383_36396 [Gossypium arboreum]|uniref:Uncharacterized protein n=1 Tax=Gossypium arboreum TaxID=29729 RepID=A0A0B0NDI6_GOSAR|nr:hypothetical protein F383_36396 [Gossypium arboreum]
MHISNPFLAHFMDDFFLKIGEFDAPNALISCFILS